LYIKKKEEEKESEEKSLSEGEADKKPSEPTIMISNHDKTTESKNEINESSDVSDSVPPNEDSSQIKKEEVTDDNNTNNNSNNNNNNNDSNNNNTTNNGDNSTSEENVEAEKPFEKELFDVNSFLMCCCCDPNQSIGIEKAFHVVSEDGKVTAEELFNVSIIILLYINIWMNKWMNDKINDKINDRVNE